MILWTTFFFFLHCFHFGLWVGILKEKCVCWFFLFLLLSGADEAESIRWPAAAAAESATAGEGSAYSGEHFLLLSAFPCRCTLKGTWSKDPSWPENVETVPKKFICRPFWLVEVLLYVHRSRRVIRDGCPGYPPRSHSFLALEGPFWWFFCYLYKRSTFLLWVIWAPWGKAMLVCTWPMKNLKRLDHNVLDTFATHAGFVCDVIDIDCGHKMVMILWLSNADF